MTTTITKQSFKRACKDFIKAQPAIGEAKEHLKDAQKEAKAHIAVIKAYMQSHDLTELDVSGFTFTNLPMEKLSWSEKNVATILQDESFFDTYRQQFTQTKPSFSFRPPKRVRSASNDE